MTTSEAVGRLSVGIMGTGYVGLVTAACLAHLGHAVTCYDTDDSRVAALRRGVVPISEPGLDELLDEGRRSGRIAFGDDLQSLRHCQLVIVAVGTLDERGEWTDAYVRRAIKQVVEAEMLPKIVVVRSTLLPGTLASIAQATRLIDGDVELYLNPEFTREGTAVGDFLNPDRIVIGTTAHRGQMIGAALLRLAYATLGRPVLVTDSTTAELIKVGSNMVLAAKVALTNELARLAATLDADISSAVDGIGMDHRIGRAFLTPGPGIGGSCLPSQARAVDRLSMATGTSTPLISAVARSNGMQTKWVAETLERLVSPAASVAVLGVTFKAGTDDIRESPALAVAAELDERGWSVAIHDPVSGHAGARWLEARGVNVFVSASVYEVVRDRDAVLIATEWSDYRAIDWVVVASEMRGDLVFDGRGIVDSEAVSSAGLRLAVHGRLTR